MAGMLSLEYFDPSPYYKCILLRYQQGLVLPNVRVQTPAHYDVSFIGNRVG